MKPTKLNKAKGFLTSVLFHSKRWLGVPYRLHNWLFETGTRAVALISAAGMLGYAAVFIANGQRLTSLPLYYKFAATPHWVIVAVFLTVGIAQLLLLPTHSPRRNIISGFFLVVSALVWCLVFAAFDAARPPANTGMVFSIIMAVCCALAGLRLTDISKRLREQG